MNGPALETVADIGAAYERLHETLAAVLVGQEGPLRLGFITLLCSAHSLIEGVPGIGKTLLVRALAACLDVRFGRVQFTPDLLPGDVIGMPMLDPTRGELRFRPGPLFTDLLLADEINRAPAKTQAALLEAMQERAATVDGATPRARPPLRGVRHPEPDRAGGHLSAARGRARPLPVQDRHGLPERGGGARHPAPAPRRPSHAGRAAAGARRGGARAGARRWCGR